jgi:hypothetical protein
MSMYVAEKIKDVMVMPWPTMNDERVFILQAIQDALKHGLVTQFDVQCGLRYCAGNKARQYETNIQHFLTVLSTLTGYTDKAFVEKHFEHDTDMDKLVKIAMMQHKGLWE